MANLFKSFIRSMSFFRKEIVEVIRQPRLILTLVFGPFLILLLFGVGYRNEPRAVRTVFVTDESSELAKQIKENAPTISPQLIYVGTIPDKDPALRRLASGEIDLVIVAPENAYETIRSNQQATFELYHNEIDPAQIGYVEYLGQVVVDEVNRRVLASMAQQGQTEASDIQQKIGDARSKAAAMKDALRSGDIAQARSQQAELRARISDISLAVGASAGLLGGVQQNVGSNSSSSTPEDETLKLLSEIQNSTANTNDLQDGKTSYDTEIQDLEKTENDLADLQNKLTEFQSISPNVLIRPFQSKSISISKVQFTPMDFFTPGVIVLLLQHIAVTIAALSIVRERRSGTMELFRVSPISSAETLVGKYLSYMIFGLFIGAILSLLLAYGLRVPMLGSWQDFSIVIVAVLFASLGIGFIISLSAQTESQAVQLSMIILLLSVFFSGFLLDLRYLLPSVKVVSWALPATYGSVLLQSIMLRGRGLIPLYIFGLVGIGIALMVIAWFLLRYRMRHE